MQVPPGALSTVFKYVSPQSITFMVEIAINRHKFPVTTDQVKLLKKHKKYYDRLSNCCNKNKHKKRMVYISMARNHLITSKQTGEALPKLLDVFLPRVGENGVVSTLECT